MSTGFQRRCYQRLEKLADGAMISENYTEAAGYLSTMLSLDAEDRVDILIKRSRARVMMESWEDALRDADEVYSVSSHHETVHDKVCRWSNLTHRLTEGTSSGMWHYMARDVIRKPFQPLIKCCQHSGNLLTKIFVASHFFSITRGRSRLIDTHNRTLFSFWRCQAYYSRPGRHSCLPPATGTHRYYHRSAM